MAGNGSAPNWTNAGTTNSVDAVVLRFAAVLNGLFESAVDDGNDWFLVDRSGHLIDCSAETIGASSLLGSPVTKIAGGVAADSLASAWSQVLLGRAQAVWPWQGGRAKATTRSIELHPIRDVLTEDSPVVGALLVIVDSQLVEQAISLAA